MSAVASATATPPGCVAACRGCRHRYLTRAQSEGQKARFLAAKLAPWRDRLMPLQGVASAAARWGYRDRVCLAAAWDSDKGWALGLTWREQVIPIPHCPVHSLRVRQSLAALLPKLPPKPVFPLSHWVQTGGQLTLVLKTAQLPERQWMDEELTAALVAAGVEGFWWHLHPCAGVRLFTKRGWHLLWGRPWSQTKEGWRYGPSAFQQQLPELYGATLTAAVEFLAPGVEDGVLDLYCGLGLSLSRWLQRGCRVLGVELAGEAVAFAHQNAPGAALLRGACAARLVQIKAWLAGIAGRRLLYVNPPRTGLEAEVLAWLVATRPVVRVAYLSCSATTLARDLTAMTAAGYRVEGLYPFDFFPQTDHVETLALLRLEAEV